MKKSYKALSVLGVLAASVFTFNLTGCFDPVFYQVNQDVVSEDALVSGSINSIARYTTSSDSKEYLVLAAGKLMYKLATGQAHGQWKTYNSDYLPFELHHYDYYSAQEHVGQQIIKVLSDSDYLYLVSAEYQNNSDEGTNCPMKIHLWAAKITDWGTKPAWEDLNPSSNSTNYFPLYSVDDYYYSAFNVFSTNSVIQANRKVYIRTGYANGSSYYKAAKYYKCDGLTVSDASEITDANVIDTGSTNSVNSVAVVNGLTLFFSSTAVTTNETCSYKDDGSIDSTTGATCYYYGSSTNLYYGTDSTDNKKYCDVDSTIASLAYCTDCILVGCGNFNATSSTTSGGIQKVQLTSDVPESSTGSFTTNAQSQLLTSYIVMTLLNATPGESELDSALYATLNFVGTASSTTASFSNVGLWSYYPNRGNWNRE